MKRPLNLIACALLAMLPPAMLKAQWADTQQGELVIRGGWLFDGISDERRRNTGIVVRDGEIVAVDANVQEQVLSAANVLDLADADTILPGMIDLHAHYNLDLVDKGRVEEVVYNGIVFLANGVTSTWSAGEYFPERVIAQRDRTASVRFVSSRIQNAPRGSEPRGGCEVSRRFFLRA